MMASTIRFLPAWPTLEPNDRDDADHGHDHRGLADVGLGDEPEQGHHERVHQADESGDRQRFAARHGIRPEDRVVSDRNSHKQQADKCRRSRSHRGKVGVVRTRHHANRSWHGRSVMSIEWTLSLASMMSGSRVLSPDHGPVHRRRSRTSAWWRSRLLHVTVLPCQFREWAGSGRRAANSPRS
jgi:hypothetical protein